MAQKKIPMRQCLGCREMFPKRELIRVVRSPEGELSLDFKGKAPGRGAAGEREGRCPHSSRGSGSTCMAHSCSSVMPST